MELKFTPRRIKEVEDVAKQPISEILGEFSITNLALLVFKGANLESTEQALDVMEKEFEAGETDMYKLYFDVVDNLQKNGFFPKGVDLTQLREKLTQGENLNLDSSETSGKEESQQQ